LLAKDGYTDYKASTLQRQASPKKKKGAKTKLQQTLGLVMQSALPEKIEKICHHNLISDSTLTLPHIQGFLDDHTSYHRHFLIDVAFIIS